MPESGFGVLSFEGVERLSELRATLNCLTAVRNSAASRASSCAAAWVSVAPLAVFCAARATPTMFWTISWLPLAASPRFRFRGYDVEGSFVLLCGFRLPLGRLVSTRRPRHCAIVIGVFYVIAVCYKAWNQ